MANVEILLENIVKRRGRFTLRIDRLRIGERLVLVAGPNGSGKSTLLSLMAGVLRPNRGRIEYNVGGERLSVEEAWSKLRLGFLLDSVEPPDATVEQLLDMTCLNDCSDVIEGLGLRKVLAERYATLSTGYRKRVKLALAYARRPRVALIDEPFNGIDYDSIWAIREFITEQAEERYTLTIIASHIDPGLDFQRVIILQDGRITYDGDPQESPVPRMCTPYRG
ncbi:ABC transporter-related protein [Pyrolobus fumarii 1A]|uniref:ABC transporter-related protein n=1 Tax=Pyrolobus fumarii (strain DSM 11204 / 1A) TaxID=694429 RepID=G0EGG5_PYRF1|nr:ABC transporter ATP-binding protein [Pyrolobus fumarii]AEM38339.1 ABC transporter-related protein [Pyrolobus fumarii 1A]